MDATANDKRFNGLVAYTYAYDVAYDTRRAAVGELLGSPVADFDLQTGKRGPRNAFFYRPRMLRLPEVERTGPRGKVRLSQSVKLFSVGAVSITVRAPFEGLTLAKLVDWHDPTFDDGPLSEHVRRLAEQVAAELAPMLVRPVQPLREAEAYTTFCVYPPAPAAEGGFDAQAWLTDHRREVAALLTQEDDPGRLSDPEIEESTSRQLSYYRNDLAVVDWDAAVVLDRPEVIDEYLHIIELANVQLVELAAYDRLLDETLQRAYRDLARSPFARRRDVLGELRELHLDMVRLSDELGNITKFFGDWHLARIHQHLADRFHLGDWRRVINEKLSALSQMYQMSKQDQTNRWMVVLELTIVLLFILDVILLVMRLG